MKTLSKLRPQRRLKPDNDLHIQFTQDKAGSFCESELSEFTSLFTPPRRFFTLQNSDKMQETEIWKQYLNSNYYVSNLGRFRNGERLLTPSLNRFGYLYITLCFNGKAVKFYVHNLMWKVFNGDPGLYQIDHIDNCKTNNKLSNLQLLTCRENTSKHRKTKQKTSKYTGVCFNKQRGLWVAQYRVKKQVHYLGYFKTEHDAHLKYQEAIKTLS